MPRVIHFELPADDTERASRFYADVFGWTFQKWDSPEEYLLIGTGAKEQPGIDGGMMRRCADAPSRTPINIIDVPDVDGYVARIESAGGRIVMPKTHIPGVGYLAYFTDTEGIVSGIMQFEQAAAK